jgi:hypothetical protein
MSHRAFQQVLKGCLLAALAAPAGAQDSGLLTYRDPQNRRDRTGE